MPNPADVLRHAPNDVETRSWARRRWRWLAVAAIVLAAVVVAVIQALNASTPAPHPLSVAATKRAFAAAGISIAPAPAAILTIGGGFAPSAILAYAPDGDIAQSPHAVFVVVYPNAKDAAAASLFAGTVLNQSLNRARARNVLVEWRGTEDPAVSAAIKRLR